MLDCLIIDDEESIGKTVCEYFALFNVSCEYASDYETGLKSAAEKQPSVVLLDINLGPGTSDPSGFVLCKKLRETSNVPIIFLSVRDTDDDILAALGIGGDDYITKPFSMAVLLAKVKAVLKRKETDGKEQKRSVISFSDIEIERDSGRVSRGGQSVKLKPMEFKMLLYLIDNQGRRITKDELLKKVWGGTFVGEGTLSVHIRHLREKLENDPQNPVFFKTMWGSGYMFEMQK